MKTSIKGDFKEIKVSTKEKEIIEKIYNSIDKNSFRNACFEFEDMSSIRDNFVEVYDCPEGDQLVVIKNDNQFTVIVSNGKYFWSDRDAKQVMISTRDYKAMSVLMEENIGPLFN